MRWILLWLLVSTLPADDPLLNSFRGEFVEITPGKGKFPARFRFGCAKAGSSPGEVPIETSFAIAKYEVPQNLWEAVMGGNPSRWKGQRNSVEMVSMDESREFCRKITLLMRNQKLIRQDQVVRLPTEVEWEYAARAGTTTKFSFGDDVAKLDDYAWSTRNAAGNDPPVGAKKPNPWGLYDIHGYLWEWCEPSPGYERREKSETAAVMRGGSWKDRAAELRSCSRRVAEKSFKDDAVGFRCVLANIDTNSLQ